MKKLLILNGSHSDIPLINAGKKLGYWVITTGNDPELIGHSLSNEYYECDFSDIEDSLRLASDLKIDAVCSCANDFGAITASAIAQELQLPGHDSLDVSLALHRKDGFKKLASALSLSVAPSNTYDSAQEISYEIESEFSAKIVKPIDLTGGKGVSVVHRPSALANAVDKALSLSKQSRVLVEQFIPGTLHSFSSYLLDRKVKFSYCDNELSFSDPFLVTTSGGPSEHIGLIRSRLVDEVERIADYLELSNGIFHVQYMFHENEFYMVDITRRCSGDFYPLPVSLSASIDWAEWIVRSEVGLPVGDFPNAVQQGFYGRHCIYASNNGVFDQVHISPEIRANVLQVIPCLQNNCVQMYREQKYAVAILKFESTLQMARLLSDMDKYFDVR
jgi:biotin carboxylase